MNDSFDRRNTVAVAENEHFLRYKLRNTSTNILKDAEFEMKISNNDNRNLFKLTKIIFTLKPAERTPEMIEKVYRWTKELKFFKKIREEHSEDIHFACCKYMQHEFHPANSLIIKQGDSGTKFYIILEGKISVIFENEDGTQNILAELGQGDSFGERALILGVARACSVRCINSCSLGVLEISDYKRILESLMEELNNSLISMLRELPMLRNRSSHYLQRLTYYFKSRKLNKKQVVYKEGDTANEVYLIQKGEFELSKRVIISLKSPRAFPVKSALKNKKISKSTPIAILAKGSMFGEEEIFSNQEYRAATCVCVSNEGCILTITKENFQKLILKSDEAFDYMKKRTINKLGIRQNVIEQTTYLQKIKNGIITFKLDDDELPRIMTPGVSKTPTIKIPILTRDYSPIQPDLNPKTLILKHLRTTDIRPTTSLLSPKQSPSISEQFQMKLDFNSKVTSPRVLNFSTEAQDHLSPTCLPSKSLSSDPDNRNQTKNLSSESPSTTPVATNKFERKASLIPLYAFSYVQSPMKRRSKKSKTVKSIVNIHTFMMKQELNSPKKSSLEGISREFHKNRRFL